jgi:hypothetical protein
MQLQLGGNSQGLVSLITLLGKQLVPTLYKSLTVTGTAKSLPDIPEGAVAAHITVETGVTLRYTLDGTTATTTVGHLLANAQILEIVGSVAISKFSIIEVTGGTSSIKITYYV